MTSPKPPVVIVPAGPGRVLVRGCPRNALDLLALDRVWDAAGQGWVLHEIAADVVVDWARRAGRAVELVEVSPAGANPARSGAGSEGEEAR